MAKGKGRKTLFFKSSCVVQAMEYRHGKYYQMRLDDGDKSQLRPSAAIGLSMAATAIVARRIGEGNKEAAATAAMQSIYIGVTVSILIGIPGFIYAEEILRAMRGSEELIATGKGYTKIMLGSNLVIMLLFLLNGVFRGAGNAAIAMRSLWVANIINIILDPVLIFGWGPFPELGVQGAAVATFIGRGVGVLYQLYVLFFGNSLIRFNLKSLQPDWQVIKKLVDIGSTGFFQFFVASASWIFLMAIMASFGSQAVAGYVIAIRLLIFTILPSWGLANAAATLVGQNLGAKQPERAEKSVWRSAFFNMVFLFSVSVIYFVFAPAIVGFFTPVEEVIHAGVLSLRIISAGYVFFAYGMVISQAFNGAGDTRTPTLLNLICFWAIEIPLSYFLAVTLGWQLQGICIGIAASESLLAVLCIIIFKRGRWKLKEV